MNALASLLATVPPLAAENDDLPPAISADAVIFLMLGVGVFLTAVLIAFFAYVIWYESKRSGTNPEAKKDNPV